MDTLNLRQRILLNQPHIESISGNIANFTTDMKAPLKECKVYFEPIQEGEGDPSPDNIRPISGWTGVNIYNDPKYGGNIVWNQCLDPSTITISNNTSSNFDVTTTETGFNVVLNSDVSGNGSRVVYFSIKWNKTQNHRYMFLCKISNTLNYSYLYFYHPNGSTNRKYSSDTSEQFFGLESYNGSTGKTKSILRLYIYGIDMKAGESFEVSDLMAIDLDEMFGTPIIDELYENTTTSAQKIEWFKNIIKDYSYHEYNAGEVTTVSAVNGDPYTSIPINWTDNIGTVYGGYVDLAKGELVAEWVKLDISSLTFINQTAVSSETDMFSFNIKTIYGGDYGSGYIQPSIISSIYKSMPIIDFIQQYPSWVVSISNSGSRIIFSTPSSLYSTVEDFIEAMDNKKIIIKLLNPIHYPLSSQQLLTFKGTNNIWSNSNGQTEVKFWTH